MHPECLSDRDWREDNLDTLPQWHPCFYFVRPEVDDLAKQLSTLFSDYLVYMRQVTSDPSPDLITHIEDEALTYFGNLVLAEMGKIRQSIN
jgi:hypothetical protein